jgi:hypothetical protein
MRTRKPPLGGLVLLLAFPPAVGSLSTASAAVEVVVYPVTGPASSSAACSGEAAGGPVIVQAIPNPSEGIQPSKIERRLHPPASLTLSLDPSFSWSISAILEGCWAPSVELEAGLREPQTVELPLWPLGRLEGTVRWPKGHPPPAALEARFEPVPLAANAETSSPRVPRGTVPCSITDVRWSCELPSGNLDIRLTAGDYAPHYVWGVEVLPGKATQIGEVLFKEGASLAGWATRAGPAGHQPIVIELRPELLGAEETPAGRRMEGRVRRTTTNQRGFFQLKGLTSGDYSLTARAEDSFSPRRISSLRVEAPEEYLLDQPVTLELRPRLEVGVFPLTDADLQPWKVTLERELALSSLTAPVAETETDLDGWAAFDRLEQGRYVFSIYDSRGNRHDREAVELISGEHRVQAELKTVPVHGVISSGKRPMARRLVFLTLDGAGKSTFESDDGGVFSGYLAQEGSWRVEVQPAEGRGKLFLFEWMEIERLSDGVAHVTIELPDTRLFGEVRNEDDEPVSPALVTVFRDDLPLAQVWSQEDGSFEIVGLEPGTVHLKAEAPGQRESPLVTETIKSKGDSGPAHLTLGRKMVLEVHVSSGGRPVAGARVRYFNEAAFVQGEAVAGPNGETSLTLPRGVSFLDVAVLAPGLPAKIGRYTVPEGASPRWNLTMDSSGGQLTIALGNEPLSLLHDGGSLPIWNLLFPSGSQPPRELDRQTGELVLELEGGEYALCEGQEGDRRCVGGFLPPQGSLRLEAPSANAVGRAAPRPGSRSLGALR